MNIDYERLTLEQIKADLQSEHPTKTVEDWAGIVTYYSNNPALAYRFAKEIPCEQYYQIIRNLEVKGYIKYDDPSHDVPLFNGEKLRTYYRGWPTHYDNDGYVVIPPAIEEARRQGRSR